MEKMKVSEMWGSVCEGLKRALSSRGRLLMVFGVMTGCAMPKIMIRNEQAEVVDSQIKENELDKKREQLSSRVRTMFQELKNRGREMYVDERVAEKRWDCAYKLHEIVQLECIADGMTVEDGRRQEIQAQINYLRRSLDRDCFTLPFSEGEAEINMRWRHEAEWLYDKDMSIVERWLNTTLLAENALKTDGKFSEDTLMQAYLARPIPVFEEFFPDIVTFEDFKFKFIYGEYLRL